MNRVAVMTVCVSAVLAAGCGGSAGNRSAAGSSPSGTTPDATVTQRTATTHSGGGTTPRRATARPGAPGPVVRVVRSQYGPVVADARGEAFYLFGKDSAYVSECYGECARRWPPALAKGKPRAGTGAVGRLLGTA